MADSTDRAAGSEEARSRRACAYCPQPGADVCVREYPSASGGSGYAIYAHRACAEAHGDTILWVPTGRAS
jgi:hypothetical protein